MASKFNGLGNKANYQPTVKMQFRGQDKAHSGAHDNVNEAGNDDYILNLQQQIHFMELELKILKEKVIEDEKNSGIGSLFDDDKTSHQHIQLLKTKYAEMRRNFDRNKDKLQQEHLKIISDQFVLQAQIKTIREQNADLDKQLKEYETVANKRNFDLDTEGKGLLKQKTDLDNENKSLDMQF